MTKLSVIVITFNEEKDIGECLKSIRWADEIIVIDSFSSDKTVEIAKKFTDKVIQRKWPGFSEQKNFAAELASNKWILQLDADERVTETLKEEILKVINDSESLNGYYIARRNYWLGKWIRHGGWYPDYALRLFRKGKGKWQGLTHEKFIVDGKIGILKNDLIHDNLKSVNEHLQKQLISTMQEVREAANNNLRIYWLFPFRVFFGFLFDFLKGPKTWLSFRILYKEKIKNKVDVVWLIPFYPIVKFLYMYIIRLGFLDGWHGFWVATLSGIYEAIRYAKIWEYQYLKSKGLITLDDINNLDKIQQIYKNYWPSA